MVTAASLTPPAPLHVMLFVVWFSLGDPPPTVMIVTLLKEKTATRYWDQDWDWDQDHRWDQDWDQDSTRTGTGPRTRTGTRNRTRTGTRTGTKTRPRTRTGTRTLMTLEAPKKFFRNHRRLP